MKISSVSTLLNKYPMVDDHGDMCVGKDGAHYVITMDLKDMDTMGDICVGKDGAHYFISMDLKNVDTNSYRPPINGSSDLHGTYVHHEENQKY